MLLVCLCVVFLQGFCPSAGVDHCSFLKGYIILKRDLKFDTFILLNDNKRELSYFVLSQDRVAASCDQHVVAALQDAAHRTIGPEQKT